MATVPDVLIGAGVTPGESSTPPETPPAKEAVKPDTPAPSSDVKVSQPPAPAGDQEKDKPVNGMIPYSRFKEVNEAKLAAEQSLAALADKGFSTPEEAEFVLAELAKAEERANHFESQLRDDPFAHAQQWAKAHPDSYNRFGAALISGFLEQQAAKEARDGKAPEADFLRSLMPSDTTPRRTASSQPQPAERDTWQKERQTDFDDRVDEDLESAIRKRTESIAKAVQFADDEQRDLFNDLVMRDLKKHFSGNEVFIRKINTLADSRKGLTREQRAEIVKAYETQAMAGGFLERTVANALRRLSLQATNGTPKPPEAKKDLAAGATAAPGGADRADRAEQISQLKGKLNRNEITQIQFNEQFLKL